MFRLTRKSLAATKVRVALTTFGVLLAVSFVVSAFVLGDGLRTAFTDVSEDVTAGVDLQVRATSDFGDPGPLPDDAVDAIAPIDGVAAAVPSITADENAVQPVGPDGEPVSTTGAPIVATTWVDEPGVGPFTIDDGAAPGVGEFAMDRDSAATHGFRIGDTYELLTPDGPHDLRLSGTTSFGPDNSTLGALLLQVSPDQAGELFGVDGVDDVSVVLDDGADADAVAAAIADAVPGAEVIDQTTLLDETASAYTDEIDLFANILLGFGGVALFVSVFIIYNTFAIVLSQRTRELALLRTVGASPTQIRRSVLGEAVVIGVVASTGGIVGGVAVAKALEAAFGAMGADLPDYPLILATRTWVAAAVVGIGVTLVAAIGPARRAAEIAPVAALRDGAEAGAATSRTRSLAGLGLLAVGAATGAVGLSGAGSTATTVAALATGAVATFGGVTLLSPLAVGPVTRVAGAPLAAATGVAGRLARRNAARTPRRTATTAAALMIGLALVTTAMVIGRSLETSFRSTFDDHAVATHFLTDDLEDVGFPAAVADELASSDAVAAVTGLASVEARIDGDVTPIVAARLDQLPQLLDLEVADRLDPTTATADPSMMVSTDVAAERGLAVGDPVDVELADGTTATATVSATYADRSIVPTDYVADTSLLAGSTLDVDDDWVLMAVADDAPATEVDALVADLADRFPQARVETAAQFGDRIAADIDQSLAMVNVMVALAVVIALIGIANTLALSVFERTRELGLLRAVGMARRQLRRSIRVEAALVAAFGAIAGVAVGLLFGWAVVQATAEAGVSSLAIPVGPIVTLVVLAGLAGVVAAWFPARRAGRLDVLDAIAT